MMDKKVVLVTGGAGYIGSHTCIELCNAGYEIVIIDNFSNSSKLVIDRMREISNSNFIFYEGDVTCQSTMRRIFTLHKIDSVIHFAGFKSVNESVNNPLKYFYNNICSTITLCNIMQEFGCKQLVFSSSATVYGDNAMVPIVESSLLSTTNPYGRSKLMAEEILTDLCKSDRSWSVVSLRYFNPAGAHKSGLIGEDPNDVPNNLMPYISQVAVGKLDKLKVFGGDYPTHDGTGVRDYIHVVDLAKGHLNALKKITALAGFVPINLGSGLGYSVLDVIKSFESQNGMKIPYEITNRRQGDVPESFADIAQAKSLLDWTPEFTIDDICKDAWYWQSKNPNGFH